jgi:serine/threonine protein kinase
VEAVAGRVGDCLTQNTRVPARARKQGHFSEKDAAEKMQNLLDFIDFAHSQNIIHRDL